MACWCVHDLVVVFVTGLSFVFNMVLLVAAIAMLPVAYNKICDWWRRRQNEVRVYASLLVCETCLKRIPAGYMVKKC